MWPTFCTRAEILANGINAGAAIETWARLALVDVHVTVHALVAFLTLAHKTAEVVRTCGIELARVWLENNSQRQYSNFILLPRIRWYPPDICPPSTRGDNDKWLRPLNNPFRIRSLRHTDYASSGRLLDSTDRDTSISCLKHSCQIKLHSNSVGHTHTHCLVCHFVATEFNSTCRIVSHAPKHLISKRTKHLLNRGFKVAWWWSWWSIDRIIHHGL